jgi:membrane peptidoglycan carboxypeptidase
VLDARTNSREGRAGVFSRLRKRWFLVSGLVVGVLLGLPCTSALVWIQEGAELGRTHAAHELSHPGWSFPGRVRSLSVPLDGSVSPKRLVAEAKARDYKLHCPNPGRGEYCEANGKVVARDGDRLEPLVLGTLIGSDAELRTHLPLDKAPKHLVDAIVASEDRDFRSHHGVNLTALGRALFANSREGQYAQGGSTLSMQVVRALSRHSEKTIRRKLRELGLAVGLERALGKDEVLQMYLDVPYLGQRGNLSVCGFQEAARHYFGVEAEKLSIAQAATLVAILPSPGKLAPDKNPEACKARRDRVLNAMAQVFGYDVKAALEEPLKLKPALPAPAERFPSYLSAVRARLEDELPKDVVYGAGLDVEVPIDVPMQLEAEKLFAAKTQLYSELVGIKRNGPLQSVGVALDIETGAVKALYGGTEVSTSGFNRVTQAHRQPGSSFKPVVYALAMSTLAADGKPRFTAASTEPNSPREFKTPAGTWRPMNVGGEATVTASLAQALTWSQNIATASLLEELGGPAPLIAFAKRAGFDTRHFPMELGLALGQAEVTPLEMAQFAAMVANGGHRVEATPVLRAVDLSGVERVHPPKPLEQVLTPQAAALTRELMRLVVEAGTGGGIRGVAGEAGYQGAAIGKTGTTDSEKDVWFVGATPRTATVVWLGYDLPATIGGSAADFAAPLWGWWMGHTAALDGAPPDFPKEPKLARVGICTETGLLPNPTCKVIAAPFLPGTAPKASCETEHPEQDTGWNNAAHESLWKKKFPPDAGSPPDAGAAQAEPEPPKLREGDGEGE